MAAPQSAISERCGMIVFLLPEDFGEGREIQVSFISIDTDDEFVTWQESESVKIRKSTHEDDDPRIVYEKVKDYKIAGADGFVQKP